MPRLSFRHLIITTLLGFSLCFPSTVSSVNAQEASLSGAAKVRQDIEQQRLKKQETEKQYTSEAGCRHSCRTACAGDPKATAGSPGSRDCGSH
jgi:hypothetical protein